MERKPHDEKIKKQFHKGRMMEMYMMTKEEYKNTNWKMTYEQYQKCYCPECDKANCPHREAFRRVSKIDGGLGLCPRLKEK